MTWIKVFFSFHFHDFLVCATTDFCQRLRYSTIFGCEKLEFICRRVDLLFGILKIPITFKLKKNKRNNSGLNGSKYWAFSAVSFLRPATDVPLITITSSEITFKSAKSLCSETFIVTIALVTHRSAAFSLLVTGSLKAAKSLGYEPFTGKQETTFVLLECTAIDLVIQGREFSLAVSAPNLRSLWMRSINRKVWLGKSNTLNFSWKKNLFFEERQT